MSPLTRPRLSMPDFVREALEACGLMNFLPLATTLPAERLSELDHARQTPGDAAETPEPDAG